MGSAPAPEERPDLSVRYRRRCAYR